MIITYNLKSPQQYEYHCYDKICEILFLYHEMSKNNLLMEYFFWMLQDELLVLNEADHR